MSRLKRRKILQMLGCLPACTVPLPAIAALREPRQLSFLHLHTGQDLSLTYYDGLAYVPESMQRIEHFLGDFRTRQTCPIDPGLLDFLHALQSQTGHREPFQIISGYRSPATNERLRNNSSGVAKKSLHMQGKAIDIRLQGYDTGWLRKAAIELARGGVGYYPQSDFLHIDTGRVRHW